MRQPEPMGFLEAMRVRRARRVQTYLRCKDCLGVVGAPAEGRRRVVSLGTCVACGGEIERAEIPSTAKRPRVSVANVERAKAAAEGYRVAVKAAREAWDSWYGEVWLRKRHGERLSDADFSLYFEASRMLKAIDQAAAGRTRARTKRLIVLAGRINGQLEMP